MLTWKIRLYRLWHTVDKLNSPRVPTILWTAAFLLPLTFLAIITPVLIYSFSYTDSLELPAPLVIFTYLLFAISVSIIPLIIVALLLRKSYNRYIDESEEVIAVMFAKKENPPDYKSAAWYTLLDQWTHLPLSVPRKSLLLQAGIPAETATSPEVNRLTNEDLTVMAGLIHLGMPAGK